jgi:enoyl-CoA hydratase/carnithine racemase
MICCASDFVIAADNPDLYFSLPEIDVGIFPVGGTLLLGYSRFGFGLSKQMFLIPQKVSLEVAIQKNFVVETASMEELDSHTLDFCRMLAKKSPAILYLTKAVINKVHYEDMDKIYGWENEAIEQCNTNDESQWDAFVNRLWNSEQ